MRFVEPTEEHRKAWDKWLAKLPKKLRKIARKFDPWTLYRMKKTDQRVTLCSIADDGTLTVIVSGRFNRCLNERQVFGVPPSDLEECDLPGPDEELGTMLTPQQFAESIDLMRAMVRPDLWVLDEHGKAVRKQ